MLILATIDSDTSSAAVDHLESWVRARILEPFYWVRCGTTEPGLLINGTDRKACGYGEALVGRVDQARFMGLAALDADDPVPAGFNDELDRAFKDFSRSMPGSVHRLEFPLVVAPSAPRVGTSRGELSLAGLLKPDARVFPTIVLAPEDRRNAFEVDESANDEAHYPSWVALGVATLGCLWTTWPEDRPRTDPIDRARDRLEPGRGGDDPVQVVRCNARIVDGGFLPDHLAARVLHLQRSTGAGWPPPDVKNARNVGDNEEFERALLRAFLKKHRDTLGYEPVEQEKLSQKGVTWLEGLKMLFVYLWAELRRRPIDLLESRAKRVHDRLAGWVEHMGADEAAQVHVAKWRRRGVKPPARKGPLWKHLWGIVMGRGVLESEEEVAHTEEVPRMYLKPPDGPVADTWVDLRHVAFGLIDGSKIPADVLSDTGVRDEHPFVERPGWVTPDPRVEPGSSERVPVQRSCDPVGARAAQALLGDDPAAQAALDSWVQTRRSFFWSIAEHIDETATKLDEEAAQAEESQRVRTAGPDAAATDAETGAGSGEAGGAPAESKEQEDKPSAEEEREEQRRKITGRFLRLAFVLLVLGIVGVTASWWLSGILAVILLWASIPVAIVLILLAAVRAGRKLFRLQQDDAKEGLAWLYDEMRRLQYPADASRLRRRYAELLDWADIVGQLVHEPWVASKSIELEETVPVERDALPAALELANGEVTETQFEIRANRLRRKLFHNSWLRELYDDVEEKAMTELRDDSGLEVMPAPDREPPQGLLGNPREFLVHVVEEGTHRSVTDQTLAADLIQLISENPLDDLYTSVGANGDTEDGATLAPISVWGDPALPDLADELRRVAVRFSADCTGCSGVIVDPDGLILTNRHCIEGTTADLTVTLENGTTRAVRVVRVAPDTDAALIEITDRADGERFAFAKIADWTKVRQGQRLLSLGFPLLLEGGPTLEQGILSSLAREISLEPLAMLGRIRTFQHDVPSVGGASGSPMFDLDCAVVGLHCARAVAAEYIGFAVPCDALVALVAAHKAGTDDGVEDIVKPIGPTRTPVTAEAGSETVSAFLDEALALPPKAQFRADLFVTPRPNEEYTLEQLVSVDEVMTLSAAEAWDAVRNSIEFGRAIRLTSVRIDFSRPVPPDRLTITQ